MDVLVVRAGALGDVLLLRRAVAALRRARHRVHLVAPSAPGPVLVGPGPAEVSRFTPLDGPRWAAWLGEGAARSDLAEDLRADAVVALTRSGDLLARLGQLAPRVFQRDPSPPPGSEASRWFAEPVRGLGGEPGADPSVLEFTAPERERARELAQRLPSRFLAVHPGSGSTLKNWPADRFAALVRALAPGRRWLLVSGPADEGSVARLREAPGALVARDLPVRVLGALLAGAAVYIGNDSGVTHLAAAAGAPTLALFGPTDAETWAPVGPVVETLTSPDGTMESLDLARVQEAAARLLSRAEQQE